MNVGEIKRFTVPVAALLIGFAGASSMPTAEPSRPAGAGDSIPAVTDTVRPMDTVRQTLSPASSSETLQPKPSPSPTKEVPIQTTWKYDLYNARDVRWQEPDSCTAATVQMALNMISTNESGGDGFKWDSDITQWPILRYERKHMLSLRSSKGSDPWGERNALNHFGWGGKAVYEDQAYSTFDDASKAIVLSIARTHKPAIVFSWKGGHTQLITGYLIEGKDPVDPSTINGDFKILGVFLTDPLRRDGYKDVFVKLKNWRESGPSNLRFGRYSQTDVGKTARDRWLGKYVAVLAIQ
jgi:hypothetical protein